MTMFLSLIWIRQLGWSLLHFLWQGTVIAALYALIRYLPARSASAHSRYLLACGALAAMAAAPLITFFAIPQAADAAPRISWGVGVNAWAGTLPAVVIVWLAGVLGFSIRLLGACRVTRRLRSASSSAPAEWQAVLDRAAAGVARGKSAAQRAVALLISPIVQVPTVIGYFRPAILVPVSFLAGLPVEQVEALLVHEVAHIRRNDYLISVLQSIVEVILFYHPAVWWISREIRLEREFCCDDLTIGAGADLLTYSRALSMLEASRSGLQLQPAANAGSLLDRIKRMLEPAAGTPNYLPGAPSALAMVALLAVGAGVTSIHGAQTGSLVTGKSSVTVSKSAAEAPGDVDPLPARRESLALQAARTLLFDPVFSAQLQRPQPPAGFNTNAQAADAATLLSRAKSLDDGVGKAADAIALYRQVLATPSVQRVYAAYSQFRIAQLTLETGDPRGQPQRRTRSCNNTPTLKISFPRTSASIALTGVPRRLLPGPSQFDANGTFHYPGAGVELNAQGWSAKPVAPSSGGGVALILADPAT